MSIISRVVQTFEGVAIGGVAIDKNPISIDSGGAMTWPFGSGGSGGSGGGQP